MQPKICRDSNILVGEPLTQQSMPQLRKSQRKYQQPLTKSVTNQSERQPEGGQRQSRTVFRDEEAKKSQILSHIGVRETVIRP